MVQNSFVLVRKLANQKDFFLAKGTAPQSPAPHTLASYNLFVVLITISLLIRQSYIISSFLVSRIRFS